MRKLLLAVHLILSVVFFLFTACSTLWKINNPYEQVDWKQNGQYKANLHTHTTRSDGGLSPQYVVDKYHHLGYQILAITDHNEVTYPWTSLSAMKASKKSEQKVAEGSLQKENINYENRVPELLGMIAIQGNEVSAPHHTGSLFNDYNHSTQQTDSAYCAISAKNGLMIMNHPGRYNHTALWHTNLYRKYNQLVGMEIFNNGDRYTHDRQLWDSVLVALAPVRPVWAYSNDDMHSEKSLGRNWNIFVLPELTEEWVRKGIEEGRSFYVYSPEGHKNQVMTKILSIQVNHKKGSIRIMASGQDSIRWISNGKIVQKGRLLNLKDCPEPPAYIRAEIFGPGGFIMGTQPFLVQKERANKTK